MVRNNQTPGSYTLQWKTEISPPLNAAASGQSLSSESQDLVKSRLRYCSACNNCKRSRVKCSGGNPCRRCADSSHPSQCIYRTSQRQGRRKANNEKTKGSSKSTFAAWQVQSSTESWFSDTQEQAGSQLVDRRTHQMIPNESPNIENAVSLRLDLV